MSRDRDREEQRLHDAIEQSRRAANEHDDEPLEDELLFVRRQRKKKKPVTRDLD